MVCITPPPQVLLRRGRAAATRRRWRRLPGTEVARERASGKAWGLPRLLPWNDASLEAGENGVSNGLVDVRSAAGVWLLHRLLLPRGCGCCCTSALKRGMYMPNASWRRWGLASASRGVSETMIRSVNDAAQGSQSAADALIAKSGAWTGSTGQRLSALLESIEGRSANFNAARRAGGRALVYGLLPACHVCGNYVAPNGLPLCGAEEAGDGRGGCRCAH